MIGNGLNASECCRTIGCNCAGTQLIENLAGLPLWEWMLLLFGLGLILSYIIYKMNLETKI